MNTPTAIPMTFDDPSYCDHFVLTAANDFDNIDDFVERLAMRQPPWLTRLSMGISGHARLRCAVADALAGGSLGNWKTIDRTATSITFAEDMRVLRYRLVFEIETSSQVSARTEVVQQSRWLGPIYWFLATPLHQRFLQAMLRRAGGDDSTTRARALVAEDR